MNYLINTKISLFFIYSIPVLLILGPALPDIIITGFSFYIFSLIIYNIYKKIFFLDIYLKILLLVFCIILITTFFSNYFYHSFLEYIVDIRYFLFCYFIIFFFNVKKLKYFLYLLFFISIFLQFDLWFQYFIGYDIFGNVPNMQGRQRLNGPFGDKYVIGSYITKISLPVIGYFFYKNKSLYLNFNIKNILTYLFPIFSILAVLFSGERMALILFFLGFILILIFLNKLKILIMYIFIFVILFFISINYSTNVKFKYYEFIYKLGFDQKLEIAENVNVSEKNFVSLKKNNSFFDEGHGAHFKVAFHIFKNNILFGSGFKTFRYECKKPIYDITNLNSKIRCSTHPHNIYMEALSDTGLVGFLTILFFFLFIILKIIQTSQFKNEMCGFVCLFIVLIWPISSIGNFFNNWNAILNLLFIGIILSYSKYQKEN